MADRPDDRPDDHVAPFEPQGRALLDHWTGGVDATIVVHARDGEPECVPAALFFRGAGELLPWEHAALAECRGRVLDVGAGAGCHALVLAARGHPVVALDVCPSCAQVMAARGVADARTGVPAEVDDGPYDTLLMLMHGVGIAGDLPGLAWLLADAHRLLGHGGRIVLDSRGPGDGEAAAAIELWMEYRGVTGAHFWWLFLTAEALAEEAARVGWRTRIVHRDADGRYVAVLDRAGEETTASAP